MISKEKSAYCKAWYQKNKKDILARRAKKRDESLRYFQRRVRTHKNMLNALKAVPCLDCKQCFPAVSMDFDHVTSGKRYPLAQMNNHRAEAVQAELVCSNCHRVRTSNRAQPEERKAA